MAALNKEAVEKLIDMYQQRQLLWNTTLKSYHNKTKKGLALREIAAELQITEDAVKSKINILRTQYGTERQKELASKMSGPESDVYVSKWHHYKRLKFLEDYITPRKTVSNLQAEATENAINDQNQEDEGTGNEKYVPKSRPSIGKKRSVREFEDALRKVAADNLKEMKEKQNKRNKVDPDDADEIFGKHVANELSSITSIIGKSLAKVRIQNIIHEIRCSELQQQGALFLNQSSAGTTNWHRPSTSQFAFQPSSSLLPTSFPSSQDSNLDTQGYSYDTDRMSEGSAEPHITETKILLE